MILSLKAINFQSYQALEYTIEKPGMVAVEAVYDGEEDRSNGAGKSSFLPEALAWVLYGETTEGVKDVCYNGAEECRVELVLPFIKVVRSQNASGTDNKIEIDGGPRKLADAKAYLAKLFPPKELFCSTLIVGQGVAERFSNWTPAVRAQKLSDLAGLERWRQARAVMSKERKRLSTELNQAQGSYQTLQRQLASLRAAQSQERRPVATIEAELSKVQTQERAVSAEWQGHNQAQMAAAAEASKANGEVVRIETEMRGINNAIASSAMCPTCQRPYSKDQVSKAQKGYQGQLKALKTQLKKAQDWYTAQHQDSMAHQNDLATVGIQLRTLGAQLQQLNAELVGAQSVQAQSEQLVRDTENAAALLASAQHAIQQLDILDKAFVEIPIRKLGSVLEAVNAKLVEMCNNVWESEFLVQLRSDRELKQGTTKAEINLYVESRAGRYQKSSVGQRRKIDLSIQMALREVLLGTWPNPITLLVCDDVVDVLDWWAKGRLYRNYLAPLAQRSAVFVMSPQGKYPMPMDAKITVFYTEDQGSWIGAYDGANSQAPTVSFNATHT